MANESGNAITAVGALTAAEAKQRRRSTPICHFACHIVVTPSARWTPYLECHQLGSSPALGSSVSAMGRGGSSAFFR